MRERLGTLCGYHGTTAYGRRSADVSTIRQTCNACLQRVPATRAGWHHRTAEVSKALDQQQTRQGAVLAVPQSTPGPPAPKMTSDAAAKYLHLRSAWALIYTPGGKLSATPASWLVLHALTHFTVMLLQAFILTPQAMGPLTAWFAFVAGGERQQCVLVVLVLYANTLLSFFPACMFHIANDGALDNRHRRGMMDAYSSGFGHRAWAAHKNAHEGFPAVGVAVACALSLDVPSASLAHLCTLHLCARVVFHASYLSALDPVRSLSWIISFQSTAWIFVMTIWPGSFVLKMLGL